MTIFMFALAFPYNHWTLPENNIGFVVLYSLTFFFANFGPNATTFVVPAEIFPARLRSTCHGISAASGKLGAIVGAFGFLYLAQNKDPAKADAGYPAGIGVKNALIVLGVINLLGFFFTFLEKINFLNKEAETPSQEAASVSWTETSDTVSRHFQFHSDGQLSVKVLNDSRPIIHKVSESFVNTFFPSGYPYSVNEGYLRYTQFRALQHFSSAALSVLSTQSLLYAAGLRPTPAQATAVSWIIKDGMQHVGKLICSNLGARMDSEPKRWRVFADVLYDAGTALEVLSPLCPQLFLEMAGLGNFAKGMATVAARATRLPIYSSFAKEGNLSDLYAKGEAISTVFNVFGLGAGIQLVSTVCQSMQGKMVVGSMLSIIHVYSTYEEMRAAPINTLNPQRTAMIVEDFLKSGKVSSPADLRYKEDLLFPGRVIKEAGNVKVGRDLHKAMKPSRLKQLKEIFPDEKFVLNFGNRTDMVLEQNASGEDALRGWLLAAYASPSANPEVEELEEAYEKMNMVMPTLLSELQAKGWHTDRFLDGRGSRYGF
ncbi:hypothetical protein CTI12_AA061740 [Artemisia annua]|uniref:Major facilitator superfamily (MFS) profile domain-containing protein n=1 Tax=Artemisia annua TaxID=35608 RepID=A0A2U1PCM9_ARTAN|nr:hypothetical protein CTI12_AA061740 [Artemisia annua]